MRDSDRRPRLMIVDDEPNFSESLTMALEDMFAVSTARSIKDARESLKEGMPDVLLVDVRLPDGHGVDLLQEVKGLNPMPVVIVMTAFATVENAVRALKEGAVDYFIKPLDIDKLKRELGICLENRVLQRKVASLDSEIKKILPPFITAGRGKMKGIVERVPVIAPLGIPVLITGETGTGKEKLARWIHSLSGLSGEMVAINCAALPKDILESELFGYAKGAFSGALSFKEGLIEKAEGGTFFLDEIGELSDDIQAKFLRVLEDGVFFKLGETKERRVAFRLVVATAKDLSDPSCNFRQDLFYRVNGISFDLPPLRERRDDIPLLVSAFIEEADYAYKKDVRGVTSAGMAFLANQDWPGNVRELKWCIHRSVAIASGSTLDADEIYSVNGMQRRPSADERRHFSVPLEAAIEDLEKRYIENALASAGSKTDAAKILGISVRVLHYKIKKYNL